MMSLLPEGQLAMYAMQGNDNPLAIMGDWATTFNNCEGTNALAIKSIVPIAISRHSNEAP
jgi:hypothetical protein